MKVKTKTPHGWTHGWTSELSSLTQEDNTVRFAYTKKSSIGQNHFLVGTNG